MHPLTSMFRPESIAVVGASEDPTKWGYGVFNNITHGGFKGRVYPVNPNAATVLGAPSYRSLRDIPERLDLAFIVIPAPFVLGAVKDAVETGVRSIIIITAGFGETGIEGRKREAEVRALCAEAGIPTAGPNCMGICSFPVSLVATMEPLKSEPGHLSFISQSGTYGVTTLNYGLHLHLPFNAFVSSGNEAVTKFADYMEYFGQDDDTHVIMGYIESLRDAQKFMRVAKDVAGRKPVVVMKFGRTDDGSRAAASHTGALAGSNAIYDAMFKQCGVIQVTRTHDLLNVAMAFDMQPPLRGNRIAIIGPSGGFGVATTDFLAEHGLKVPEIDFMLQRKLREEADALPFASLRNPIDLAADLRVDPLLKCTDTVLNLDTIDGAIIGLHSRPFPPEERLLRRLEEIQHDTGKPMCICYFSRPEGMDVVQSMTRIIPVYRSAEDVGQVMSCLWQYGKRLNGLNGG
ncbi:MAG: CoA-binding protein [Dehalococcoidia bacterium]|nr:CoA-binding protein [Dehalococcoidia bacterium]